MHTGKSLGSAKLAWLGPILSGQAARLKLRKPIDDLMSVLGIPTSHLQQSPAPSVPGLSFSLSGWFSLAKSDELPRGTLIGRVLCGKAVVLFRTEGGVVHALDGHCPHLGVPFSPGGRVEGETLVCGYHAFCFDATGACVRTGYGTKPPPNARVASWPVVERDGRILVWHGARGEAPTWAAPTLDSAGWLVGPTYQWSLASHPQDWAENAVDLGHFTANHGFRDVTLEEACFDGPILRTTYAFERDNPYGPGVIYVRLRFTMHGLGIYDMVTETAPFGLVHRFQFTATPTTGGRMTFTFFSAAKPIASSRAVHPGLALIPPGWVSHAVLLVGFGVGLKDVVADFPFIQGKRFSERPALAVGDGPIGLFRKWARQFYASGDIGSG